MKPSSGGDLILQDESATAHITLKDGILGYRMYGMHVITVGSGNYAKPVNVTALHITATGGGGGGASGSDNWNVGAGGAAGGTLITFTTGLPVAATNYAYVVGALGAGAAANDAANGIVGATTTLAINSISAGGGGFGTGLQTFTQAAVGTC